ncbi:endoglucanase Acf2 [Metabacillus crassostreae]|uniref:glycosyl hydrolase n=1 Tax=Metabacillus crassostreae TaxID=929098 RepID=UPI0019581EDD|nr:glycosyl hydrolase [Metabacillus crassostreae]MBM7602519.1 endoglucanase Acf2 [Metabacillus crassostreae]
MKRRSKHQKYLAMLSIIVLLLSTILPVTSVFAEDEGTVSVGAGNYRTSIDGLNYGSPQSEIFKTINLEGAIPTNEWWSSAIWKDFSSAIYPHPLAVKAYDQGLGIDYPEVTVEPNTREDGKDFVNALYEDKDKDLVLGGEGLTAEAALVDGYSDWAVDLLFENANKSKKLKTTISHGSPYIFATYSNTNPQIHVNGQATVWSGNQDSSVLGVTINGNHYGVFAPTGTTWTGLDTNTFTAKLPSGTDYISIAVLPDSSTETLAFYEQHAYSFITDSKVDYSYDEQTSKVTTNLSVTTELKEAGKDKSTIMALYPHQWRNTTNELLDYEYRSPRGTMKTIAGNSVTTVLTYHGMLPYMPTLGADKTRLQQLVDQVEAEEQLVRPGLEGDGPYWVGKNLNRLSQLLPIANQLGDNEAATKFKVAMENELADWFTAPADRDKKFFYYDNNWGTLLGYPNGFGAETSINDHHFHWGYWVYAAALLEQNDNWATTNDFDEMVELLIKDMANWDRTDTSMFPYLRNFDPYAGHAWASGNGTDLYGGDGSVTAEPGNNQESSSESINAWAGMIMWGEATGNDEIRDAGIYMYTTEVDAINNYWFDIDNMNLPEEYKYEYAPMVFSSGSEYRVWWTKNSEEVHGINMLPITASSFYLGFDPEYMKANYNTMVEENGGVEQEWAEVFWMYQAMYDPATALEKFNTTDYAAEYGESKAHTYQWITNFAELGNVDRSVTADTSMYAVFDKDGVKTYMAFNPDNQDKTVTFTSIDSSSPAVELIVPANSVGSTVRNTNLSDTSKPDLVVTDIITDPSVPATGDTITFKVKVQNQGYTEAKNSDSAVGMIINVNDELLGWGGSSDPITPGETVELALRADWSSPATSWTATKGTQTITAHVNNPDNGSRGFEEVNVENNVLSKEILVEDPPKTNELFLRSLGSLPVRTLLKEQGGTEVNDRLSADHNSVMYEVKDVLGDYQGSGSSVYELEVDAATNTDAAIQVKLSYDFNNDGTIDRTELFAPHKLDHSEGFETITSDNTSAEITGAYNNFSYGRVQVELINLTPESAIDVKVNSKSAAKVQLPYNAINITRKAELVLKDFTWEPAEPKAGDTVTFQVVVENQGNATAKDGNGAVGFDMQVNGEVLGWGGVSTPIGAGETVTMSLRSDWSSPGSWTAKAGTNKIKVNVNNQKNIVESSFDNNILEKNITVEGEGNPPDQTEKEWVEVGENLVIDGEFKSTTEFGNGDNPIEGWNIHNQGDFETGAGLAEFSVVDEALNAKIQQVGWDWWQIQLFQNVNLSAGTYKVAFDAKSDLERPLYVELQGTDRQSFTINDTMKSYETILEVSNDGTAKLLIGLGKAAADTELTVPYNVVIDNVRIVEVEEQLSQPEPDPVKDWVEIGENLVIDGGFDTTTNFGKAPDELVEGWNIFNMGEHDPNGGKAIFSVNNKELNVTVEQPGWELWHIQLLQNLDIPAGTYKLAFDAKSEIERPVYAEVQGSGMQTLTVTDTMQTHEKIIEVGADGVKQLLIGLGKTAADPTLTTPYNIVIDNVRLIEVAEDPGTEDPGTEDPGTEDPGTEDPGTEDPGTEDPGTEDPGTEDPGTEDPGTEDPGTEDPVTKPIVQVKPKFNASTNKATINLDAIKELTTNGTLELNLEELKNQTKVIVELDSNQVKALKEKNAVIHLKKGEVDLLISASNLTGEGTVQIAMTKFKDNKDALAPVYDFTITQGKKIIDTFDTPVTLKFKVDKFKDANKVKIYYYDEKKSEWISIGGTVKDGYVTAETDHFTIFTVFENSIGNQPPTEEPKDNDESNDKEQKTDKPEQSISKDENGKKLPDTATNTHNTLLLGGLLTIIGLLYIGRNRLLLRK